jgi:hypothetical protein
VLFIVNKRNGKFPPGRYMSLSLQVDSYPLPLLADSHAIR